MRKQPVAADRAPTSPVSVGGLPPQSWHLILERRGVKRRQPDGLTSSEGMVPEAQTALQLARRHVANGSRLVDEQSARIAQMDAKGDQIVLARALLETMRRTLDIFIADLKRLESPGLAQAATRPGRRPIATTSRDTSGGRRVNTRLTDTLRGAVLVKCCSNLGSLNVTDHDQAKPPAHRCRGNARGMAVRPPVP